MVSGSEGGAAGRASKGLDLLSTAMLAIANQRVDMRLSDPKVQALSVGTGKALSFHASGVHLGGF